jgi:hypothetical protein
MKTETTHAAAEAMKAAPPLSVGGLTLFGYPLSEVVLVLTAIYTIWLIVEKTPKVIDAVVNIIGRLNGRK